MTHPQFVQPQCVGLRPVFSPPPCPNLFSSLYSRKWEQLHLTKKPQLIQWELSLNPEASHSHCHLSSLLHLTRCSHSVTGSQRDCKCQQITVKGLCAAHSENTVSLAEPVCMQHDRGCNHWRHNPNVCSLLDTCVVREQAVLKCWANSNSNTPGPNRASLLLLLLLAEEAQHPQVAVQMRPHTHTQTANVHVAKECKHTRQVSERKAQTCTAECCWLLIQHIHRSSAQAAQHTQSNPCPQTTADQHGSTCKPHLCWPRCWLPKQGLSSCFAPLATCQPPQSNREPGTCSTSTHTLTRHVSPPQARSTSTPRIRGKE